MKNIRFSKYEEVNIYLQKKKSILKNIHFKNIIIIVFQNILFLEIYQNTIFLFIKKYIF